jgi:PST family polysaccharide transporter
MDAESTEPAGHPAARQGSPGRHSVESSFAWASAGRFTLQAANLAALTVSSRFLTPADFGLFAPVAVLTAFVYAASDGAFAVPLLQRSDLHDDHVRVAFWGSLLTAVAMTAAVVAASPLIERGFGFPGLAAVVAWSAAMLPARLISTVPTALLHRQMRFRETATLGLVATIVAKLLPIVVLSVLGFGVWALVAGFVAQAYLEMVLLLWRARPHMAWPRSWQSARDVLGFGGRFTAIQTMNQIAQNIDNVIVGRLLGPVALGFYTRVFALMMLPVNLIGGSAQQVLFARFSQLQSDRLALRHELRYALDLVCGLILPLTALLAIMTDTLVLTVLGEQWTPTILPTRILLLMVSFRIGYKLTETVAFATAALTPALVRQACYAGLIAVGALVGSAWDLAGVAAGVGAALAIFFVSSLYAAMRLVGERWRTVAVLYARGLLITLLAAGPAAVIDLAGGNSLAARLATDATAALLFAGTMALIMFKGPRWLGGASRDLVQRLAARPVPLVDAPAPQPAGI